MGSRFELDGRPCLVVGGAGNGIGSSIALAAAEAGAAVGVITHNTEHAADMTQRLEAAGAPCAAAVADIHDEGALVDAVRRLQGELGPFRHLVNVVGGSMKYYERAAVFDMAVFDRLISYNLRYAVITCREVASTLIELGLSGSIVNISSGTSRGSPMLAGYGAAKAGLETFGRAMALEWGHHGIRVNAVSCGTIRTARTGFEGKEESVGSIPLRRRGDAIEVAAATLFLLSDLAGYTTGQTLDVDGGMGLGHPGGEEAPPFRTGVHNLRASDPGH